MSVIIPKAIPTSTAANAARNSATAPDDGYALAGKRGGKPGPAAVPAATVEISSAARQASAAGQGQAPAHKIRPLNIIWGDSPR